MNVFVASAKFLCVSISIEPCPGKCLIEVNILFLLCSSIKIEAYLETVSGFFP